MKYLKTFLILIFPIICFSQKTVTYSCSEIKTGVIDSILYKTINGKLLLEVHNYKGKAYKISNKDENKLYYVSKPIMKRIRRSIRKNKCKNILIEKIDNLSDTDIKIIRD